MCIRDSSVRHGPPHRRTVRGPSVGSDRASAARLTCTGCCTLSVTRAAKSADNLLPSRRRRGWVGLPQAKLVALRVAAGREPTHARHRARLVGLATKLRHAGAAITNMEPSKQGIRPYFDVDDINAGAARVTELGGEANEPGPVPGMGWFATCRDPQGNEFGLWQTDPSAPAPTG